MKKIIIRNGRCISSVRTLAEERLVVTHEEVARLAFREIETFGATRLRERGGQKPAITWVYILCKDYPERADLSAMLVPMNQSSEKRISCSSYTFAGKASGRLPGMNVVASNGGSCLHRQNLARAVGLTGIFPGMGKEQECSQKSGVEFSVSTPRRSPYTSCNICKSDPPVFATIPAMTKENSGQAGEWETETPVAAMVFRVGPGFHLVQSLNKPLEKSCHAAAMTGLELEFSGCRSAGGRSDRLVGVIHRRGFTKPETKVVRKAHNGPSKI